MTDISRRDFLKASGAAGGAALVPSPIEARTEGDAAFPLHKPVTGVPTICTYCAVGCGQIVGVQEGRVVSIEGDPDHPISRGRLCSKGMAARQIQSMEESRQYGAEEPRGFTPGARKTPPGRLTRVLYRAPGGDRWEEKSWDWALDQLADRFKATRDANWIAKNAAGQDVNRTEALACLGGAQNTNEECYLLAKAMRSLGVVYVEHQARI
jgi:formate dehydrogenase major subunit